MTSVPLYLDHAATTPLLPAAREAMLAGFVHWANPSSPHAQGRAARAMLEEARARVKAALNWQGEVIFTSGASEAVGLAMTRSALPLAGISAVEHDVVLRHAGEAQRLAVSGGGLVDLDRCALPGVVAIQQVNNETGVIQPLDQIAPAVRGAGGLLLADCAQGAGKMPLPDADLIALSAHKFGGPVGVGALLVKEWSMLLPSGGQERGYRGGTENLPAIMAMAASLEAGSGWLDTAAELRKLLEAGLVASGGEVIAGTSPRLPTIGAYRMPGRTARAQLISFDRQGIAVSAGSACSSGSLRSSHVLGAMGMATAAAGEVIRVSIGRETRAVDIERFLGAWTAMRAGT